MSNIKNLANDLVATAPSPQTSGTTLSVRTGAGATFPTTPFYVTLTPPSSMSTIGVSEIVKVIAVSGDTFTIVRAQKGTSAKSVDVNWVVSNALYAEDVGIPTGSLMPFAGISAPAGWLLAYGQTVAISDYPELYAALRRDMGAFTVTIATPGVVTLNSHGLRTGDKVYLYTTGALPTGLATNTAYYAHVIDTNTFHLSTTNANSYNGTYIATSGTQSGTQSISYVPWGNGDGSTTFNVPDTRGVVLAGKDDMGGTAANLLNLAASGGIRGYNLGNTGGGQTANYGAGNYMAAIQVFTTGGTFYNDGYFVTGDSYTATLRHYVSGSAADAANAETQNDGIKVIGTSSDGNNVQPTSITNYIVKT